MPHVFSLHRTYKETSRVQPSVELAELFYDAGFHVWERQTTAYDGLSFLQTAHEILDKVGFDPDGKLRADIYSIMGEFYDNMGSVHRDESVNRHTAALVIRQKIYDANPEDKNSDVLLRNATSDLGTCFLNKNMFEKAAQSFEHCYERYKVWGTEEQIPFEYSKYYLNMGLVLAWRGRYDDAVRSLQQCIRLAGKHSTQTWHYCEYMFVFGCVLLQSGDVQGALNAHLETLKSRVDLFGKHETSTIASTYAVGAMYHHIGDPQSAM
jgi:hypothetical protein